MWPARYFAPRYWASRFWPKVGAEPTDITVCDEKHLALAFPAEPALAMRFPTERVLACAIEAEPTLVLRC